MPKEKIKAVSAKDKASLEKDVKELMKLGVREEHTKGLLDSSDPAIETNIRAFHEALAEAHEQRVKQVRGK